MKVTSIDVHNAEELRIVQQWTDTSFFERILIRLNFAKLFTVSLNKVRNLAEFTVTSSAKSKSWDVPLADIDVRLTWDLETRAEPTAISSVPEGKESLCVSLGSKYDPDPDGYGGMVLGMYPRNRYHEAVELYTTIAEFLTS